MKDTELNTERGDADITIDKSPYTEWLAAQGLLNLCQDQPKEGDIRNLHGDSNKDKGKSDDNKDNEDVTNKQNVDLTKEKSKREKSIDNTDEIENCDDFINQEKANSNIDDSMERRQLLKWKIRIYMKVLKT